MSDSDEHSYDNRMGTHKQSWKNYHDGHDIRSSMIHDRCDASRLKNYDKKHGSPNCEPADENRRRKEQKIRQSVGKEHGDSIRTSEIRLEKHDNDRSASHEVRRSTSHGNDHEKRRSTDDHEIRQSTGPSDKHEIRQRGSTSHAGDREIRRSTSHRDDREIRRSTSHEGDREIRRSTSHRDDREIRRSTSHEGDREIRRSTSHGDTSTNVKRRSGSSEHDHSSVKKVKVEGLKGASSKRDYSSSSSSSDSSQSSSLDSSSSSSEGDRRRSHSDKKNKKKKVVKEKKSKHRGRVSSPVQLSKFMREKDKHLKNSETARSSVSGKKLKLKVKKSKKDKERDKNRAQILDFLNASM